MKIVLINNLYGSNARGGAERVVEDEAKLLVGAGHEVTVISTTAQTQVADADDQIKTKQFRPINIYVYGDGKKHQLLAKLIWHFWDTFNIYDGLRIIFYLKKIKPDVVHTHNLMGVGFLLPRLLKQFGFKQVHTLHDVQLLYPSGLLSDPSAWSKTLKIMVAAYSLVMKWVVGSPDRVTSPSSFVLKLHNTYGFFKKSKQVVLENLVSGQSTGLIKTSRSFKYLFAGQLEVHKGILFLISVWQHWGSAKSKLIIAGQGSLVEVVLALIKNNPSIEFVGQLSRQELTAKFQEVDFLIFPSLVIENAPRIILESLASATPVIATRIGGVGEIIKDNENGFLFESGSRADLLNCLNQSLDIDLKQMSIQASSTPGRSSSSFNFLIKKLTCGD